MRFPLLLLFLFASCWNKDTGVDVYHSAKSAPPSQTESMTSHDSETSAPSKYLWQAPEAWKKSGGSSMRIGSFAIPGKSNKSDEEGDLSLVLLSGNGGGVVANFNRWRGQLGLPSADDSTIMQSVQNITTPLGDLHFSFLTNSTTQQGMLVSLITHQNQTLFVKATGPLSTLEYQQKAFLKFIKDIHVQ